MTDITDAQKKKWAYFKHTKPCYAIINGQECQNDKCNYAHNLEQYMKAITKRGFEVDESVVRQFELLEENLIPTAKRKCIRNQMEY